LLRLETVSFFVEEFISLKEELIFWRIDDWFSLMELLEKVSFFSKIKEIIYLFLQKYIIPWISIKRLVIFSLEFFRAEMFVFIWMFM